MLELSYQVGVKDKIDPRTVHEDPEGEEKYDSALSWTSTLDRIRWSTPRCGRFSLGKEAQHPLYRGLGGPHWRSERVRKISAPPGIDPRIVQPLASTYIDDTISDIRIT